MNYFRKIINAAHLGGFVEKLELDNDRAIQDMVYSYIKCMPLAITEMSLRQNLQSVGTVVRIPNFNNKPTWGAWLALTVTSYIIDIPAGATIYMFDAWNEIKRVEHGPNSYMAHLRGRTFTDFHSLRSETAVVRLVITSEHEEDGDAIILRFIDPLVNEYAGGIIANDYRQTLVNTVDPVDMSGREYFALINTLVSVNPTKDARVMKGLNYTDAAPAAILEEVKRRALIQMHIAPN